ncbi:MULTISPECIES: hypothetical protein [unclassified Thioalkalivibrio]|uniref:hypothetical protein n=1 Tax=unclassified Thioalkalivibrio TaxID=2621013 RepID=UPI000362362D|nr:MULTISPECIES: hypothetical protein [unclassified Thioalkalivibrio]
MHDRKSLSLAAELRRNLRAEFPAVARLSVTNADFMEAILDYASRSQSSTARAAALALRTELHRSGHLAPPSAAPDTPERRVEPQRRRVYRGQIIDE